MSTPTNHWKLGLFVLASMALGLAAVVLFAGHMLSEESVRYTSYFDESVSGLSQGSPVSYRGVTIGTVSEINIARDRRHVEISYELGYQELARLGLSAGQGDETRIRVPPDLRVQVGSSGVTGTKYLQLDFFDPKANPPPELPFEVPEHYIPAAISTFKSLEASVMRAADEIPEITRQLHEILAHVGGLLNEVRAQRLPEQVGETLNHASALLSILHARVEKLPLDRLSSEAQALLVQANATLRRTDALIADLGSQRGLLASVQRASDSVGDVANNASGVAIDIGPTMRELRQTLEAVRQLAEALERDSDMLVKGRARPSE